MTTIWWKTAFRKPSQQRYDHLSHRSRAPPYDKHVHKDICFAWATLSVPLDAPSSGEIFAFSSFLVGSHPKPPLAPQHAPEASSYSYLARLGLPSPNLSTFIHAGASHPPPPPAQWGRVLGGGGEGVGMCGGWQGGIGGRTPRMDRPPFCPQHTFPLPPPPGHAPFGTQSKNYHCPIGW